MNTPKLDALLREVDAANAVSVERDPADSAWEYDRKVLAVLDPLACAAPRLAAMLRVAVEALQSNAACLRTSDGREVSNCEWKALAHMEQIAAESRSDDPGTAEEGAV